MVMGRGLALSLTGLAIGAIIAAGTGRWLQSLLAGVDPVDPGVFGAAGLLVAAMTIGGASMPAFRAARIDPIDAIRTG